MTPRTVLPLAVWIGKHSSKILYIRNLVLGSKPDFLQRIPANRSFQRRRFKTQYGLFRTVRSPSRRHLPQFPLQI